MLKALVIPHFEHYSSSRFGAVDSALELVVGRTDLKCYCQRFATTAAGLPSIVAVVRRIALG